jgi:hypothetical protein
MSGGNLVLEVVLNGIFWMWLLGLLPAAVVAILKGRLLLFATGWLTFGITWFIAALPLAEEKSWWAQRFYGAARLARASDPLRHRRPARETAAWLGAVVILLLAMGLVTARPAPITGVGGQALQHSVGGPDLGLANGPCQRRGKGDWLCRAYDSQASSTLPYRVKVRGSGCWTGTLIGPADRESAKRVSGCVTIWDQIRPLDGIL